MNIGGNFGDQYLYEKVAEVTGLHISRARLLTNAIRTIYPESNANNLTKIAELCGRTFEGLEKEIYLPKGTDFIPADPVKLAEWKRLQLEATKPALQKLQSTIERAQQIVKRSAAPSLVGRIAASIDGWLLTAAPITIGAVCLISGTLIGGGIYLSGLGEFIGTDWLGNKIGDQIWISLN